MIVTGFFILYKRREIISYSSRIFILYEWKEIINDSSSIYIE